MSNLAVRSEAGAPAPKTSPRQLAALTLAAETGLLAFERGRAEAFALWREARNPPEGVSDRARWMQEHLPSQPALEALHREIEGVANTPPDLAKNRVFVALLVDSYHTRSGDNGIGTEVLVHDLTDRGFCPAAVAKGLRDLRRSSKFHPSLSEALEAVAAAQDEINGSLNTIRHITEERRRVDALILKRIAENTDEREG